MANRPIAYTLKERKGTVGNLKGKIVVQAHPTGRKRVDHRSFCDEVAHATTFTGAEVEALSLEPSNSIIYVQSIV